MRFMRCSTGSAAAGTCPALAYVDYTRPPVREKLHPNIVPQLAPISYSRAHPASDDRVPGNKDLRYLIEGWGRKARTTSMYFYAYNLAETSAPNPMLSKWGHDVPYVLANNCGFWQPETLPNFETSMHALYLGCRLAWSPSLKPQAILDELNARFYGHAAAEMAAYWKQIDDAWVETPEYSGCGFGYMRRFTPERMRQARALMERAAAACQTEQERRRVELANDSLRQFELFVQLRQTWPRGGSRRSRAMPPVGEKSASSWPKNGKINMPSRACRGRRTP